MTFKFKAGHHYTDSTESRMTIANLCVPRISDATNSCIICFAALAPGGLIVCGKASYWDGSLSLSLCLLLACVRYLMVTARLIGMGTITLMIRLLRLHHSTIMPSCPPFSFFHCLIIFILAAFVSPSSVENLSVLLSSMSLTSRHLCCLSHYFFNNLFLFNPHSWLLWGHQWLGTLKPVKENQVSIIQSLPYT